MSKYLKQVSAAINELGTDFVIPGSLLLVERLPDEEIKTAGGIIIADASNHQINSMAENRLLRVVVVALGAGYYDGGEDIPVDAKVGDILYVAKHQYKPIGNFPITSYQPDSLGLIHDEATQIRFKGGQEAIERFKAAAQGSKSEVEGGETQ